MVEFDIAKKAVIRASEYLLSLDTKIVNSSDGKDIKLEADIESEKIIIEILKETFDYPILTEESGEIGSFSKDGKYWVIDPIDGTLNFSKNIPMSCISIALFEKDEPILGIIYDFNRSEMFSGVVGEGAWLNDIPIKLSIETKPSQAVIATGFPSYRSYENDSLLTFLEKVQNFKKVRLLGSAALSLAYVAAGRFEVYAEEDIKFWDVAAGIALIKSLGGCIKVSNTKNEYGLNVICACNETIIN